MGDKGLLAILTDRPVAYHPILAKAVGRGGVTAAVMLGQLMYWTGKSRDPDGWIYKTTAQMTEETGLTRTEQATARRRLVERGLIETKLAGVPPVVHYRVIVNNVIAAVEDVSNLQETCKLICRKPANQFAENLQPSYTETTTETTSMAASPPPPPPSPPTDPPSPPTDTGGDDLDDFLPPGDRFVELRPPPDQTRDFDTPGCAILRDALAENARAVGQRGPTRFRTLEQKRKFLAAEGRLGDHLGDAIRRAMENGVNGLDRLVNYVAVLSPGDFSGNGRRGPGQRRGGQVGGEPAGFAAVREWLEQERTKVGVQDGQSA